MAHSYKKHPVIKDHTSGMKKIANRKVRRVPVELTDTLQGGGYTRHFESWDISDWAFDGMFEDVEDIGTPDWNKTYRNK